MELALNDDVKQMKAEVKAEEEEVLCSICLGHINVTESWSRPKDCNHIFCYECFRTWFKHNKTGTCPTCKVKSQVVESFSNGVKCSINTDNYLAEIAAEKAIEDGNKYPLDSEKQIISTRIHYLRRKLNLKRNLVRNPRVKCFCRYRQVMGRDCGCLNRKSTPEASIIQEITALDMLRDGITAGSIKRVDVLTNKNFRRIVHNPNTHVQKFDVPNSHNPKKANFTPAKCKSDVDSYRRRLIPFLTHELGCAHYTLEGHRFHIRRKMEWVEYIFERTQLYPVHSPNFANDLLRVVGIASFETFQHELFDFASSNLDMDAYFAIVGYRLRNGHLQAANFHVGGLQTRRIPEVVTIDDAAVIDLDDDAVVHIGDSDGEPENNAESNYLRDQMIESGSDIEINEASGLYNRPECRMRSQVFSVEPNLPSSNFSFQAHRNIDWLQDGYRGTRSPSSSNPAREDRDDSRGPSGDKRGPAEFALSQTPSTSQNSQHTQPTPTRCDHHHGFVDKETKRRNRMTKCSNYMGKIRNRACHGRNLTVDQLKRLRDELAKLSDDVTEAINRRE